MFVIVVYVRIWYKLVCNVLRTKWVDDMSNLSIWLWLNSKTECDLFLEWWVNDHLGYNWRVITFCSWRNELLVYQWHLIYVNDWLVCLTACSLLFLPLVTGYVIAVFILHLSFNKLTLAMCYHLWRGLTILHHALSSPYFSRHTRLEHQVMILAWSHDAVRERKPFLFSFFKIQSITIIHIIIPFSPAWWLDSTTHLFTHILTLLKLLVITHMT